MLSERCRIPKAPLAELVDAADLKSVDRMVVPVQVREGAPYVSLVYSVDVMHLGGGHDA